jgi:hypothetical protein
MDGEEKMRGGNPGNFLTSDVILPLGRAKHLQFWHDSFNMNLPLRVGTTPRVTLHLRTVTSPRNRHA